MDAATSSKPFPTVEMNCAVQSKVKSRLRKTAKGDGGALRVTAVEIVLLRGRIEEMTECLNPRGGAWREAVIVADETAPQCKPPQT